MRRLITLGLIVLATQGCVSVQEMCTNEGYERGTRLYFDCVQYKTAQMDKMFKSMANPQYNQGY